MGGAARRLLRARSLDVGSRLLSFCIRFLVVVPRTTAMDQAAFRALLSSSKPATNAATADASRALGSGSRKRRNDGSLATTHGGSTADKAAALKPRGQHAGKADTQKRAAESHKSTTDASKSSEPSYKRFGYVDRAAMRRAGLLDGEVEERECIMLAFKRYAHSISTQGLTWLHCSVRHL